MEVVDFSTMGVGSHPLGFSSCSLFPSSFTGPTSPLLLPKLPGSGCCSLGAQSRRDVAPQAGSG